MGAAAHLEPQPRIKSSMTLRGAHALYEVQIGIAYKTRANQRWMPVAQKDSAVGWRIGPCQLEVDGRSSIVLRLGS